MSPRLKRNLLGLLLGVLLGACLHQYAHAVVYNWDYGGVGCSGSNCWRIQTTSRNCSEVADKVQGTLFAAAMLPGSSASNFYVISCPVAQLPLSGDTTLTQQCVDKTFASCGTVSVIFRFVSVYDDDLNDDAGSSSPERLAGLIAAVFAFFMGFGTGSRLL